MKNKIIFTFLLTIGFILMANGIFQKQGLGAVKAGSAGTVTATTLNVRTGPSTSKAVLQYQNSNVFLKKGDKVTILKETKGWYQISFQFGGRTLKGYVLAEFIKKDGTENTSTKEPSNVEASGSGINAKVTATSLKVRKTPSAKGTQLTAGGRGVMLSKNTAVKILKEKTVSKVKWYYISFKYEGKTRKGYVSSEFVKLNLTKNVSAVIKAGSGVKIRKAAGADKPVLKINGTTVSLKNKTAVTITRETKDSKGNKWFRIQFTYKNAARTGYINALNAVLKGEVNKTGTVTATTLNVRKKPGTSGERLTSGGNPVTLKKGDKVTIISSKVVDNVTWYKVSFSYNGKTLTGYVSGQYISIGTSNDMPANETPKPSREPETEEPDEEEPEEPDEDEPDEEEPEEEEPDNKPEKTPIPNGKFDQYLEDQGFPDSYKEALKALYDSHPNWLFKAYQTGLDWDMVIEKESKIGLNLISKNKTSGWKSYADGAYDWTTDNFIPFDGSTWVTPSREAVEYYMDPRNFLVQNSIFQFEALEYQSEYQVQKGVENILKNTPMYNKEVRYIDDATGEEVSMLYSKIFMDAAKESGVSPYHLASRVKQEVVKSATALSDSVTGTVSGYEGYYNYYNIGATHSTKAGGAIINGLKFAQGSKVSNPSQKAAYMLPWDSPYKAIVGGAKYIGTNYINKGQNTIYLQKFNVTQASTYTHQYMANVEAANSEAAKTYTAYSGIGMLDEALVFNIPVYNNMPKETAPVPKNVKNPNNWLKVLKAGNYTLTPKFAVTDGNGDKMYTLTINDKEVASITVAAVPVSISAKAEIDGTETESKEISLSKGDNVVKIKVTAENGDVNTYQITITKTK